MTVVLAAVVWHSLRIAHGTVGALGTPQGAWTALLVWKLFWPTLILTTVALGRIWCAVCPLEFVTRIARAFGRALRLPEMSLPSWIDRNWIPALAFAAATFAIEGLDATENARLTGLLLSLLAGVAAICGLVLRNPRALCTYFCPTAAMLSSYGRCSPLTLGPLLKDDCDGCSERNCIRERPEGKIERSCVAQRGPFRRTDSDGCVLCLRCIGSCPSRNVAWGMATPSHPDDRWQLRPYEALFVAAAIGLLMRDFAGCVPYLESVLHSVPRQAAQALPMIGGSWFAATWYLVVVPMIVSTGLLVAIRLVDRSTRVSGTFSAICGGALPIVAIGHCWLSLKDLQEGVAEICFRLGIVRTSPTENLARMTSGLSITGTRGVALVLVVAAGSLAAWVWRGRHRHWHPRVAIGRAALCLAAVFGGFIALVHDPRGTPSIDYASSRTAVGIRAAQSLAVPDSQCRLLRVAQRGASACRGDWLCGRSEMRSFLCGAAGGVGLQCHCVVNDEAVVSGTLDTCGFAEEELVDAARRLCSWGSLPQATRSSLAIPDPRRSRGRSLGLMAD